MAVANWCSPPRGIGCGRCSYWSAAWNLLKPTPTQRARKKARVAEQLAATLMHARSGHAAWRLQVLTDLESLPDYEVGWGYGGGNEGAPVDEANKPVFYSVPADWGHAKSDGERWRWALEQMVYHDKGYRWNERTLRAGFCAVSSVSTRLAARCSRYLPRPTRRAR